MSDVNRHVKWPMNCLSVQARGSTVVDKGDLIFLDRQDGLRLNGTSSKTYTAFSFSQTGGATKTLASNQNLAATNFLGVAMDASDSGVTENIPVATSGYFKFPLRSPKTFRATETVMPTGSGTSLYDQKVELWSSGSTYPLGYTVRGRTRGSQATFLLRTNFGMGGRITY